MDSYELEKIERRAKDQAESVQLSSYEMHRNTVIELATFVGDLAKEIRAVWRVAEEHRVTQRNYSTLMEINARRGLEIDELKAKLNVPRDSRKVEAQKVEIKRLTEALNELRENRAAILASSDEARRSLVGQVDEWRQKFFRACTERDEWKSKCVVDVERDHLRGEIVKLKAEVDRLTKALDAALFQHEELADHYSRESRQSTEAIEVWKANCRTAERRCGELDRLHTNQAETIRGQRSTIETLKVERDTWKAEALTLRDRVGATPQSPPRQSLTDKLRQDILTAPPGRTSLDAIEALRVFEDYVRAQERAAKEANPLVKAGSSKSKISLLKEGNDISVFDNGLAEPGLRWRVTMKDGRWTEFASP